MVTLGAHNITKKEDTQQKLKVTKQFPHPKFDYILAHHDIMLLKVTTSFFPFFTSCSLMLLLQVPIALKFSQPASRLHLPSTQLSGRGSIVKQCTLSLPDCFQLQPNKSLALTASHSLHS